MFILIYLGFCFSLFKKFDEESIFDIHLMGEEEKKLHILTQFNTKINRDMSDKAEHYVNKSKSTRNNYKF